MRSRTKSHYAITSLEKIGKVSCVVTQNIDGLHSKAGTKNVIELHGTDRFVKCQTCQELSAPDPHYQTFRQTRKPPICPCGGYLKPATISFGQNLCQDDLYKSIDFAREADLAIAMGSTLGVYPAAEIPCIVAKNGHPLIVITKGVTDQDASGLITLKIDDDIASIFPEAVEQVVGMH